MASSGTRVVPPNTYRVTFLTEIGGTPQAGVPGAAWAGDNASDARLRLESFAEGPFRWFHVEWQTYRQEMRQRQIIDEFALSAAGSPAGSP